MSRTLSGAMTTAVAAPVTLPGYLIEIGFAMALRSSTRGSISWNSLSWTPRDVRVANLSTDGNGSRATGTLLVGNADMSFGTQVLSEGISGRTAKIWKFYGESPALADPVKVFDGVCDQCDFAESGPVRVTLVQTGSLLFCPRTYMTPESGFHFLPTPGQTVTWNGEKVKYTNGGV
jgi:hypothetical protein